jgi:hypothetical protein
MDETRPAEAGQLRLPSTPLRQRGSPIAGAIDGINLLTGVNDATVDQASHYRRQFTAGGRYHRLVQQSEALLHLSFLNEGPTLDVTCASAKIRLSKSFANFGCAGGCGMSGFNGPGRELLLGGR